MSGITSYGQAATLAQLPLARRRPVRLGDSPVRRRTISDVTEIPEHLLRRSKERRGALGLGGEGGDTPPAAPSEAAAAPAVVAPKAAVPAVPAEAAPPPPPPPYVTAALTRPKIPRWAVPVLAVLPLWGFVYAGSLTKPSGPTDPVLALGEEVYSAQCAACHGGGGEGGTGRPLGEVALTFTDPQQQVDWVVNGSPEAGTPYGDPARPGGQHISQSDGWGAMPAFGASLSPEEIAAVVRYEREIIGGEAETVLASGAEGGEAGTSAADSSQNEANSEGGNVGGEGGSGDSSSATPGGGESGDGATQSGNAESDGTEGDAGSEGSDSGGGTGGGTGGGEAGSTGGTTGGG